MVSQTEENYLKTLLMLANQREAISATELSRLLGVSLPTVNSMVKKLKKQGLMNYERYKPYSLTDKGKKEALSVLRKHRLAEIYLVEKMGFGWEAVHEIAEQIEHIDSEIFFDRIDEILAYPKMDPHGSPIPDKDGNFIQEKLFRLGNFNPGDVVRLVALSHDSSDFLKFLNNRELRLGAAIKILSLESFDKSMIVSYQGHPSETFSKIICDCLLVKQL